MNRPTSLALVVGARFGLLVGLALWVGGAAAIRALAPLFEDQRTAFARVDRLLLVGLVLVGAALAARVSLDRAAPPTSLVLPLGAMALGRMAAIVMRRRPKTWLTIVTAELCLGLYAFYALA